MTTLPYLYIDRTIMQASLAARQELRIAKVRTGTVYSFNSLDAMRDNQLYL